MSRFTSVVPKYPVTRGSVTLSCSLEVSLATAKQNPVTVTITGPATDTNNSVQKNRCLWCLVSYQITKPWRMVYCIV